MKQQKIILKQNRRDSHYEVVQLVNRADYFIGQRLKENQLNELLVDKRVTLIIK